MSVRVMSQVWATSAQKGSALLVLLAIADNANDEGVAWPSEETIAGKARMSERQVRRIVHQIAADGELEITARREGRSTRNTYRVVSPGQLVLMNEGSPGHISEFHPDIAMSSEPSVEPPTRERPSTDEPKNGSSVAHTSAQQLVGHFVDQTTANGGSPPPRRVTGQIARLVGELLAEGIETSRVRDGIDVLVTRRLHPATLPSAVHEASLPRPPPRRRDGVVTPDEMFQKALDERKQGM